jgi:hypothetical protein
LVEDDMAIAGIKFVDWIIKQTFGFVNGLVFNACGHFIAQLVGIVWVGRA